MSNNTQQTAVEKAKEMINTYVNLIPHPTEQYLDIDEAKQCALIQVDGILMAIQDLPIDNAIWDYWQQVEKEIINYGGDKQ
jgi:hypothetical protein